MIPIEQSFPISPSLRLYPRFPHFPAHRKCAFERQGLSVLARIQTAFRAGSRAGVLGPHTREARASGLADVGVVFHLRRVRSAKFLRSQTHSSRYYCRCSARSSPTTEGAEIAMPRRMDSVRMHMPKTTIGLLSQT